jgi:hypothetical protein
MTVFQPRRYDVNNDTARVRPFEADLLPMLAQAARELAVPARRTIPVPNPSAWRRGALVVAVVLSIVLLVPLLSDDPLGGALAIEQHGDTIYASVEDATADPEAMTNDLRAQGLPAKVEVIPVSPSLEGNWVDVVNDNLDAGYNDSRIVDLFKQLESRPRVLKIPVDFSTPFTLVVGRPAEAGESYMIGHERDVVGAYKCLGLAGLTPAEAEESITRQGYDALWYFQRSDIPETEVLDDVPTDKVITGAEFDGPTTVIVYTADPGSRATHGSESQDDQQRAASC